MPILNPENAVGMIEAGISDTSSGGGSAAWKIVLIGVMLLAGMGVGAIRWFYPFTIKDLEREIGLVGKLIEEYSTLRLDLLGRSGWEFKQRLTSVYDKMREIEDRSTVEPNRWNLRAWFALRWQEMNDVNESYLTLMTLKKEITVCYLSPVDSTELICEIPDGGRDSETAPAHLLSQSQPVQQQHRDHSSDHLMPRAEDGPTIRSQYPPSTPAKVINPSLSRLLVIHLAISMKFLHMSLVDS
ncbi:hypothetical protein PQX77_009424 [Marasmius sp. AFHP31]|nr:hypothetical protein PQX77_009424 [Marasmius sp. AFHP31]